MPAADSEHFKDLAKAGMLLSEQSGLKLAFKNQCMVSRNPHLNFHCKKNWSIPSVSPCGRKYQDLWQTRPQDKRQEGGWIQ